MLEVKIDNIVPVTEARDSFNQLVDKVEGSDDMFVLTKNGKPSAILVGVHHLEKLTGTSHEELLAEVPPAQEATPADTAIAEPVVETPVESPAPEAPVTEPSTDPFQPKVTEPVTPAADTMDNLQDSPFAFDDTASTPAPATSTTPAVSPTPDQPVDSTPPQGQNAQSNAPQAPLSDNNPL